MADLVVRSRAVVTPHGMRAASVHIRSGVITAVRDHADVGDPEELIDEGDLVVSPGLVDTHVHVNEPGRVDWEGFASATRAAAAGGVTTIVDMPLDSTPPTTSARALDSKRRAAEGRCAVDVGFWGALVPGNLDLVPRLAAEGVVGFAASTVAADGLVAPLDDETLARGLRVLAGLDVPLLVHAEDAAVLDTAAPTAAALDPRAYATWLASRPASAEVRAVERLAHLAHVAGAHLHVAHLSSGAGAAAVADARRRGVAITAEACPHHLTLVAEDVPHGATAYTCAPPIRGADDREALWAAVEAGVIGHVVSDHSPCPPRLSAGDDLMAAHAGVASLQLGLAVVWSAARERGHSPADVARWMSTAPAELAGLTSKGAIVVGRDADLAVWDPEASLVVRGADLEHRHPLTPYEGALLHGRVHATYLRGRVVHHRGAHADPAGRLVRRGVPLPQPDLVRTRRDRPPGYPRDVDDPGSDVACGI